MGRRFKVAEGAEALGRIDSETAVRRAAERLQGFTVRRLAIASGIPMRTVRRYVQQLVESGELLQTSKVKTQLGGVAPLYHWHGGEPGSQRVLDLQGDGSQEQEQVVRVVPPDLCEIVWRLMRLAVDFTAWDLVMALDEAGSEAQQDIIAYCQYLYRAGYLELVEPADAGARTGWRLRRDSGHKAPRVELVARVRDDNLGQCFEAAP